MLTRIFNWLVGDAAVDGVNPTLHRRALWLAFVITGAVYLIACALQVPTFWYHQMPGDRFFLLHSALFVLGPPPWYYWFLTFATLYAIVLRRNRATLPPAFLDLTAVFLLAWVIRQATPVMVMVDSLLLLLLMWLLLVRGHLARKLPVTLFWLAAVVLLTGHLLMVVGDYLLSPGTHSFVFNSGSLLIAWELIGSVGMLPFAVMLPVAVFARPSTQQFAHATNYTWEPALLLAPTLAVAYVVNFCARSWMMSLSYPPSPGFLSPYVVGGLGWSLTLACLAFGWWYLWRANGALRFAAFLLMALAGFRAWMALPIFQPPLNRLDLLEPLGLFIGGALALYLCAAPPVRSRWLPALLTLGAGLFVSWLWLRTAVHPPGAENWMIDAYQYELMGYDPASAAAPWVALEMVTVVVWLATLILTYFAAFGPGPRKPRSEVPHV
jgi:hypothetical protein